MSDLLPCPFCGTVKISLNEPTAEYPRGSINCPGCLVAMPGEISGASRIEEMVGSWNARVSDWQPIETAPKDGTEIWLYREDSGPFLGRWIAPCEFLTDGEREAEAIDDDEWEEPDWFYADFVAGGRVTDGAPTMWQPLPEPPRHSPAESEQVDK